MDLALLGIAVCDECDARIKVPPKFRHLVGKTVRCPRCHTRFTLRIEEASDQERIAAQQSQNRTPKKRRRSKSEIREEHVGLAIDGFRALHARLAAIAEAPRASEEQVRVWVVDALRTALGYDDSQIDTECSVMGGRVDIVIKDGDQARVVIECKNTRSRLNARVRDQAGVYAATLSAPWAVVTNGDIWKLYRVTPQPGKSPRLDLVFDVALLDNDGVSDADAENLYLLSARGLSSGDTESTYHEVRSCSPANVYQPLVSERVIAAARLDLTQRYLEEEGARVKLSDEEVEEAIRDFLDPLELS